MSRPETERILYLGLMSGTSMDGIDAALLEITPDTVALQGTATRPYSQTLRDRLHSLANAHADDLHSLATLDRELGREFALTAKRVLENAGVSATDIRAIGSHGQTVRHHPRSSEGLPYTVQIGDPATIAELTGITTIAHFRHADLAAGGEGAPLVPAFHAVQFGAQDTVRAIINIGGIANATLLDGRDVVAGFDCGPGNTLLDGWIGKQRGDDYDAGGAWSAEHSVIEPLLTRLGEDSYFRRVGPRSTGVEHFNLAWLDEHLDGTENPGDVQATLAELTALAIENSLVDLPVKPTAAYVCGGGARNTDLMRRLDRRLRSHPIALGTTDELGLDSEWVEAAAWAWLAYARLKGIPGNSPVVTGASGPRVLGGIYAPGGGAEVGAD